jgi:hypothetical protein
MAALTGGGTRAKAPNPIPADSPVALRARQEQKSPELAA